MPIRELTMFLLQRGMVLLLLGLGCFACTDVQAQPSPTTIVDNYILNRPTVSPYLNLVRRDGAGGVANYQTLVRPQLEQRQFARIQQAEINRLQQQVLVQDAAIEDAPPQRQQRVFSTGHPTRFMNLQRYYPGFGTLRQ